MDKSGRSRTVWTRSLVIGAAMAVMAIAGAAPAAGRVSSAAPSERASAVTPEPVPIGTAPDTTVADEPEDSGDATIEVEVGLGGRTRPNRPNIVKVTVTARSLVEGSVEVESNTPPTAVRHEAQIPAGTTKEFWFTASNVWDPSLTVNVWDGDSLAATKAAGAREATNDEQFVGVLPRLASRLELPARVDLAADLGTANIFPVAPEMFDLGLGALRSFDVVVAGEGDLTELDDRDLRRLMVWLDTGGMLVLDGDADADVDVLPEAWRPGSAGYVFAGAGEVRIVDLPADTDRWGDALPVVAPGAISQFSMGSEAVTDPSYDLAARSGFQQVSTLPLALGLAGYAIVIGPVLYFVLRRLGRLTFGWVAIPALALGVAVLIVGVLGSNLRRGDDASARFVQSSPAGSFTLTNVLTFSSGGGQTSIDIPAGMTVDSSSPFWMMDPARMPKTSLQVNADGSATASVGLEAAQAVTRAWIGDGVPAGLEGTASVQDDKVTGELTNTSAATLHDVAVFTESGVRRLDDLEPGQSVEFSLPMPRNQGNGFMGGRGGELWGAGWDDQGMVRQAPGTVAELGIWGLASMHVSMFPGGTVRAVGWTDELPVEGDLGGTSTVTAVSTVLPIEGDEASRATERVTTVRGFDMMPGQAPTYRIVLGPDVDADDLILTGVNRDQAGDFSNVSFLVDGEWVEVNPTERRIELPDGAVVDGVVLVQMPFDQMTGMMSEPSLVPAGAGS